MRARLAVGALVLFSLGGLAWVLAQSSLLDLEEVEVRGLRHTSAADVRRAAQVVEGEPLLLVNRGGVARRVEELPWVEDARVSFSLPGTLVVKVAERVPVAWVRAGEEVALVDRHGRVLDRRGTAPDRLPALEVELEVPSVGRRVEGATDALRVASSVPTALRPRVKALRLAGEGPSGERGGEREWQLSVEGAEVVRLGPPTDLTRKWAALQAVLERLGDRTVHSIDVRAPSVPAVRDTPDSGASSQP